MNGLAALAQQYEASQQTHYSGLWWAYWWEVRQAPEGIPKGLAALAADTFPGPNLPHPQLAGRGVTRENGLDAFVYHRPSFADLTHDIFRG